MKTNTVKNLILLLAVVVCLSEASDVNAMEHLLPFTGYHTSYSNYDYVIATTTIQSCHEGTNWQIAKTPTPILGSYDYNFTGGSLYYGNGAMPSYADIYTLYGEGLYFLSSNGNSSYLQDCRGYSTWQYGQITSFGTFISATTTPQNSYINAYTPFNNDLLVSSTTIPFVIETYITPDDIEENGSVITVQYDYRHALSVLGTSSSTPPTFRGVDTITSSHFNYYQGVMSEAYATGTYYASIRIIKTTPPPWYVFFGNGSVETLDLAEYEFYVNASTTLQEKIDANQQWELEQTLTDDTTSFEQLNIWMQQALNALLYMPPIGYASHIVDLLRATTTATSSIAITHTFPTNAPAGLAGTVLTLDASTGLTDSIASIRAMDIDTIEGDPFEKFMYWWNLLWYMALVVWILQQIFSMFEIDLTYNSKGGEYQKSGNVRGISNHGKNGLRRNQYKSYD